MAEFTFSRPTRSGTYTDANGVVWTIHASPTEMLADEWTADTAPASRYGVTSIWGPARTLQARIDAYAAGYAVAPPLAPASSSWWLLLLMSAVVLMDEDRRR